MSKDDKITWKTDRTDLREAVRGMSAIKAKKILKAGTSNDESIRTIGGMRHEQLLNLLMVCLIDGSIPEEAVLQKSK